MNFERAGGHWASYNTYHANIHVELLNLLSPDAFSTFQETEWSQCVGGQGSALEPNEELTALSAPLDP